MSFDFNPRYRFDTFIVGAGNRLAATAARAVADNPGRVHNPFFIYGDTGLGKTHLLMAIGQAARAHSPDLVVHYVTLDDFLESYLDAVSQGDVDGFHRRYRSADVVLIDDVQFLAHHRETQGELLRFAAELRQAGVQLVLTSDRPPSEISNLDEQLLTSLKSGLVADVSAPDVETRLAILHRRAEERGVDLGRDVLRVIAASDVRNVRELLGVLNRVIAFQAVSEKQLTPEAVKALLDGAEPDQIMADPSSPESTDEFGEFLSGVTATLAQHVGAWQRKLREAIGRWSGKGYNTEQLEELLANAGPADADEVIRHYEADVARLRKLQNDMADCDPEMAGDPVFRDPLRIEEAEAMVRRAQDDFEPPPPPSEAFDFADFIRSDATKMAVAAADSIIAEPGTQYNPLVIVGPSGVGKTHLLHAIGRELQANRGGWVACVSAQQFMDELVTAIEDNRVPSWRARYRRSSAFLLDNVDLIATRDRIQEETFFLFNVLFEGHRQLVFTSTARPRDIRGLDDRLVSRLEGGLTATIDPPDRALRRAVVATQLEQRVGAVDDDVVDFLADQRSESVRSVLGLGQRVITAAEAQGCVPTLELARDVIGATAARESTATRRRTSSVILSPSGGIESREKMVWVWPDPVDYIIEEMK